MPDALPGTTLPIYPGLGQVPNMLACIPSGLVMEQWEMVNKMMSVWFQFTLAIIDNLKHFCINQILGIVTLFYFTYG